MDKVDCVVIGAGVIGLAVARALALSGREVLILESEDKIGTGISSRNSEVVHAGMHYPTGSLKARLCVEGNILLHNYCHAKNVSLQRCGKLIVATQESQIPTLKLIQSRGLANGIKKLHWLDRETAIAMEPELECVAALHSPETSIVDSHALMKALLQDAEAHGATLVLRNPVTRARRNPVGLELKVGEADSTWIAAEHVYNCAGLGATQVASGIEGFPPSALPPLYLAKGNYYALSGKAPFSHLIYPVPEAAGLGVHLTLDLGGQARFGPDVEWVDHLDYTVDIGRADAFYAEIRRYWPRLSDRALQPAYAGIRPKLQGPGDPAHDFLIQQSDTHGVPGLVNLFGIESPGLTASLAIANLVVANSTMETGHNDLH